MAYLDRINACNGWDPSGFVPFLVDGAGRGWVRDRFASHLAQWPEVFRVDETAVQINPSVTGFKERSTAVGEVLERLEQRGVLPYLHGEKYPVGAERTRPDFIIDRAAATWFGTRAYGQHINGFVRDGEQLSMWIGRRAQDKRHFPLKLDHIAAGGLPHGIGFFENLAKECWEEAGIPRELARSARPVGALTYCRETKIGLKPDIIYCYDLELPGEFQPNCTDGEVDAFELRPIEEVEELVRDTEEFKPNCSLVVVDFLIRQGRLGPEVDEYLAIVQGLHPPLP
jgi:8-oxo-dGTP pyrophosphatase MutT (NUDIX family)